MRRSNLHGTVLHRARCDKPARFQVESRHSGIRRSTGRHLLAGPPDEGRLAAALRAPWPARHPPPSVDPVARLRRARGQQLAHLYAPELGQRKRARLNVLQGRRQIDPERHLLCQAEFDHL